MRCLPFLLFASLLLLFAPSAAAQDMTAEQFRVEFAKARELSDAKLMDKAVKAAPAAALRYYEELMFGRLQGDTNVETAADLLRASWQRVFEQTETTEKIERWVELNGATAREGLEKCRASLAQAWKLYSDEISKEANKAEHQRVVEQITQIARNALQLGHSLEAAEAWSIASIVANALPDKNSDDRQQTLEITKEFLDARKAWGFTGDRYYPLNSEFLKAESAKLAEKQKADEKRKAEGYDPNTKGVDGLLMPKAKTETLPLKFEALTSWENELDYGPRGGIVPPFWWIASTTKEAPQRKLDWFRRLGVWMVRLGTTKFGITLDPNDPKKTLEIDAGNKGKPTTFWFDAEKKIPYAMFFWTGSDKERLGEAEQNLAPADAVGNVYYRSAASWKTMFGQDQLVLYDDDASGTPGDADAMAAGFKTNMLGEHDSEGTPIPLFDSMRVGKGPRVPFSEFVQFPTGWFHVKKAGIQDQVSVRPFNPEYLKTGKIKLVWNHKPSAPAQLVVQGEGEFRTALFDVASGKEIEVPAATYSVIFGRISIGKGARAQSAAIYKGKFEPFTVEPGKTYELKMGAPFTMDFSRRGDQNTEIHALKILLHDASGCVMTDMHNIALFPEVLAGKDADFKTAKVVGKFLRFTDPELVVEASKAHGSIGTMAACFPMPEGYRQGEMVLKVKLPADGMKVALQMKKHPLFGAINSAWQ